MPRPSDPNAKEKLLRAAEAEFAEKGLVRAKVEDITARAGLSKGSFYLHFQSKEDAFRNLVEGVLSRLGCFVDGEEMSAQELERLCGAPAALIEDWQSRDLETFEFIWQNRGLMGVVMEGGGGADYRHLVDTFADRAASRIAERLQRGVSFGVYRADLDIHTASLFIAGAYDRYARRVVRSAERPDLAAELRALRSMVLRAIGTPAVVALVESAAEAPAKPPRKRRKPKNTEEAA